MVIYTCSICNKSFNHKGHYQSHLQTHANKTNTIPVVTYGRLECIYCKKTFASNGTLNHHINNTCKLSPQQLERDRQQTINIRLAKIEATLEEKYKAKYEAQQRKIEEMDQRLDNQDQKINEISQMRMNLYAGLKDMYSYYHKNASASKDSLEQSMVAINILEDESDLEIFNLIDNKNRRTEYGELLRELSVKLDWFTENFNNLITYIHSIKYNCEDDIIKLLALFKSINGEIYVPMNSFRYDNTEKVIKFRGFMTDSKGHNSNTFSSPTISLGF